MDTTAQPPSRSRLPVACGGCLGAHDAGPGRIPALTWLICASLHCCIVDGSLLLISLFLVICPCFIMFLGYLPLILAYFSDREHNWSSRVSSESCHPGSAMTRSELLATPSSVSNEITSSNALEAPRHPRIVHHWWPPVGISSENLLLHPLNYQRK